MAFTAVITGHSEMSAQIRAREAQEHKDRSAAMLATARNEFAADIRRGHGGPSAAARFAERIDDLIRDIAWAARDLYTVPFAICALGGYGRRMLCLHSDLDLLIVFDGPIGSGEEQLVKAVLHPLWDLRLTVGHQVRELSEFDHLDTGNPEFVLAVLDARLLAGDARVFDAVAGHLPRGGKDAARRVLSSLLSLVDQRHSTFNNTFYQLEPDVKEAPGGLRDIASARWIKALSGDSWIEGRFDERRLYEAEDLLQRIRSILHLEAGRNLNVLSHPLQEQVAEILRFGGANPQQQVEGLMGEYFRHARSVSRVLDWSRAAARGLPPRTESVPVSATLEMASDGLRFRDSRTAASDPTLWLQLFRTALDRACGVSDKALTLIQQNADRYASEDFAADDVQRQLVKDLFRPRRGMYARLSEMHDCGLLVRIFPEFGRIQCRVIRDFYHKYTVDEHTLLTLRNLESLLDPSTASRARFGSLLLELRAPELLSLALLFHDVGKWTDTDHTIESTRMAQSMLDRLAISGDARRSIEFLIRHHLEMSRIAFRRDSEDPEVVRQFATFVGTEEMLKMLCLLTLVDIGAVGPGTLTPWKEDLLWRLYVDAYNHLTLSYADDLIEKDQAGISALASARPDDVSEEELRRFVRGLPRRYLTMFDYRHVRMARALEADQLRVTMEKKGDIWELTVVTLDRPFLFSNICGVLSYFGMDILRCQAMTTQDDLVLDVVQFTDQDGFLRHNAEATGDISKMLQNVVAGAADITLLLRRREGGVFQKRRSRRIAPIVYFDSEHSEKYTVLEIVADDALGLLYRISRVISKNGCDVDLVLVSTEGQKAIDVFHITRAGRKLSEADQQELSQDLHRMLEGGHEAD